MNRVYVIILTALISANVIAGIFTYEASKENKAAEAVFSEKKQEYTAANEKLKSEKNKLDSMRSEKNPRISRFDSGSIINGDKAQLIPNTTDISVCIDAGHGITSRNSKEPVSPGSSESKATNVSGAAGEEPINLEISKKLKTILEQYGIKVDMTREKNECDKSNVERAEQANTSNYSIRIHCDGSNSESQNGISVLVPEKSYYGDSSFVSSSRELGEAILSSVTSVTGAKNNGISVRGDLTGFNWSKVPSVLVECGFVSNKEEYEKLKSDEYQQKIAEGIAEGFLNFISVEKE